MDIKVITRHAPSNYGSLLQAVATQTVLRRLGCQCEIIDYVRDDEHGLKGVLTALRGKQDWNGNTLKKIAYAVVRYSEEKLAEMKFEHMRRRHLDMTPRCRTCADLSRLDADMFMTGSDQVWGPTLNGHYDDAYFLAFVKEKPRVAYAASFGRTEFRPDVVDDYIRLLSRYDAISVRENSAVRLLADWHISCLGQVLDPTLMLTGEEWSRYVSREMRRRYVLVYQIHNDPKLGEYALRFARHAGLPLLRVSPYFHQISREGRLKWLPCLSEFLAYVKGCTYMVTDSFHGTAFALNFNRQFMEILPNNKTGSRNQSILQLMGLEDRVVTDYNDFSFVERSIDYSRVNAILDSERRKSLTVLKSLLASDDGSKGESPVIQTADN